MYQASYKNIETYKDQCEDARVSLLMPKRLTYD